MPLEALCAGSKQEAGVAAPHADKQGSAPSSVNIQGQWHIPIPSPTRAVLGEIIRGFAAPSLSPTQLLPYVPQSQLSLPERKQALPCSPISAV